MSVLNKQDEYKVNLWLVIMKYQSYARLEPTKLKESLNMLDI